MTVHPDLDMYVLDALANDIEDLEDILRILNSPSELGWRDQHPAPFTAQEITPAVLRCIRAGNVEACQYSVSEKSLVGLGNKVEPSSPADATWYRLTSSGRLVLNSWNPPPLRETGEGRSTLP